jgi:TolB-like protein
MGKDKLRSFGQHTVFEFADLTLDTGQRVVFRDALRIPLPKLTYELLLALVDGAPNVLTHQDLAELVWQGRAVTPETLAQRVMLLRRALGDDPSDPRYLRSVRGLGYQLVPIVRTRKDSDSDRALSSTSIAQRSPGEASLAEDIDLSLPAQPSIVVLPFDTFEGDPEQCNFVRGLTHDIMTRLARTRSFFVIARGSAFRFAARTHDVRAVGRMLGVRYVVQGHVQFSGRNVSINAALAEAVEGREVWAEHFHRKLEDIFETQQEITDLIVGSLSTEVELAEQRRALLETPASLDAWSAYHRGCWHMYRFTANDYEEAERFFRLAVKLDPASSRALAGLSFVHWQRAFLEISPDRSLAVQRAFDMAQQSVCLNPCDPLGHWALGRAHLLRDEMDESIAELSAATALNPSFAVGQYTLGFALMHAGDTSGSIEKAEKARRLSPYDPMGFAMLALRGFSLTLTGQHQQGAELTSRAIRQPNAHYHIVAMAAVCNVLADDTRSARRALGRLLEARPGYGAAEFLRAFRFQRQEHTRLIHAAFRRLAELR